MPGTHDGEHQRQRLEQQIGFIVEIDRAKQILRQNLLADGSRAENDAEHSWHLAVMALVLAKYAGDAAIDVGRVIRMLLIHDLVEIDAGDTFVYDEAANIGKKDRETTAADRLFNLLPADQATELRAMWDEFEARQTPEARFAEALDRLQPMLMNYQAGGGGWAKHGITADRVLAKNSVMADGAPALGEYAQRLVADAVARGILAEPV